MLVPRGTNAAASQTERRSCAEGEAIGQRLGPPSAIGREARNYAFPAAAVLWACSLCEAGPYRVSGVLRQTPGSKRRPLGRLPGLARDALSGGAGPLTSACPGACGLSRLSIPFTRCDVSGTPDLYLQRWCRRRRLRLETSSQAARGTGSGRRLQQCWPLHDPVNTTSFE